MRQNVNRRCQWIRHVIFWATAVLVLATLAAPPSTAKTRMGLSFLGGAGVFVSTDDEVYFNTDVDLYPEVGALLDVSAFRMGLKVGLIYRKIESFNVWCDGQGFCFPSPVEYTRAYLPVQAEVLVAPVDLFMEAPLLSPYAGIMAGAFVPVGDNDDTLLALSFKLGSEFRADPLILYGDVRYTHAATDESEFFGSSFNAGGFMMVVGAGLRIGL